MTPETQDRLEERLLSALRCTEGASGCWYTAERPADAGGYCENHSDLLAALRQSQDIEAAYERLKVIADAALTDFIYCQGSDFDSTDYPGMDALRAALAPAPEGRQEA